MIKQGKPLSQNSDGNYEEPLSQEDLEKMFRDSERAKAEQVRRETKNMYESDKRAKDNFEKWKKKRFS